MPKKKEVKNAQKKIAHPPPPSDEATGPGTTVPFERFGNSFFKLSVIMDKIKAELKIQAFLELVNYFVKLYVNILSQKENGRKTLAFMDGLSKFPSTGSDSKNL